MKLYYSVHKKMVNNNVFVSDNPKNCNNAYKNGNNDWLIVLKYDICL